MRDRFFNAVLFLGGTVLSLLWIVVLTRNLGEMPTPFGKIESSDPVLSGPYGLGAPDRWTANEIHALNKQVEKLLSVLEEMKGRIGE